MKSTEASTVFSHAALRHDVAFEALPKCLVGPNLSAEALPWAQLDSLGENNGMKLHRIDFPADYCDGAGCAVEIGTFTGYSALAMAEVLPHDGKVLTIERNPEYARIAQDFFDRSSSGYKITLRLGDALEVLNTLPDAKADLVFSDADKQNYSVYYKESMRILRSGGLILADNVLWYGRIFDPKDDESRAVVAFNEMVKTDHRAEKLFLTIRDGIYLIRKRVILE